MLFNRVLKVFAVILVTFVSLSVANKYKAIIVDDEMYSKCLNKPENIRDMTGLFDVSELILDNTGENFEMGGNATIVWDVEPTDRIQVVIDALYFDRSSWQPLPYKISTQNFCNVMYDKNQYWYNTWLSHVTNKEEVMDKCINVPGTKLIHERFPIDLTVDIYQSKVYNLYKIQISANAFDSSGNMRPNGVCVAFNVEFERV